MPAQVGAGGERVTAMGTVKRCVQVMRSPKELRQKPNVNQLLLPIYSLDMLAFIWIKDNPLYG